MSKGFIALPRSLETDSAWRHYSLRDRALFQYIIAHCVYTDYEYNLAGRTINLRPGQMIIMPLLVINATKYQNQLHMKYLNVLRGIKKSDSKPNDNPDT